MNAQDTYLITVGIICMGLFGVLSSAVMIYLGFRKYKR
jgi:hypothetical protein